MSRKVVVGDTTYSYKIYPFYDTVHASILFKIDRTECLSTSKEWPPFGFFRKKKLTPEMYAEATAWANDQLDLIEQSNKDLRNESSN